MRFCCRGTNGWLDSAGVRRPFWSISPDKCDDRIFLGACNGSPHIHLILPASSADQIIHLLLVWRGKRERRKMMIKLWRSNSRLPRMHLIHSLLLNADSLQGIIFHVNFLISKNISFCLRVKPCLFPSLLVLLSHWNGNIYNRSRPTFVVISSAPPDCASLSSGWNKLQEFWMNGM